MELFLLLMIVHFTVDYQFQSDAIAVGKNFSIHKAHLSVPWYYWMLSHASTHGLAVYLVTQNIWATVFQIVAHFIIDTMKCSKKLTIHQDQAMHLITMAYIAYFVS